MDISPEDARQALAAQPFSLMLGMELTAFTPEGVELRLAITERLRQQHGFVHGGAIAALIDNALTFAGGSALGPAVVTSEIKINYLRPARGDALIARAHVLHAGRTQAVCRCDVFVSGDGQEVCCAAAQGTIARTTPRAAVP
jgi:uncharacterized protein (TIGR00369 family)